ncbi:MAG TPA: SUMF1/EgtB/PvdO family nonheme iron enzyme, partial [Myxococcales bacterium]
TRSRRGEEELAPHGAAAKAALDALVRGRLLVALEATGGAAYEIAHETLIQGWPTLGRWLDETVGQRQLRARLAAAVAEWERLGRIRELLWRAPQLVETARLDVAQLPPREARFIEASGRAVLRGRLTRAGAVVGLGAAVALIAFGIWLRAHREMNAQVEARAGAGRVELSRARDKAAELERLRKRTFELFDAGDAVHGESVWTAALQAQSDADHEYAQASQELEMALSLDPTRHDLRALFAQLLFERAAGAGQAGLPQLRDELVHRLALYDNGGALQRRWSEPGQLSFSGAPEGTLLTVDRLGPDRPGRLIDAGEVKPLAVDPGSYLLTFRAPGRAEVRAPVLLGRGEMLPVAVELPPSSRVPAGFVFVPAGRFLSGTAEESLRRGFLKTAPLHAKNTGAFFIARNETTFGDFIEFLRELPAQERALRLPRVAKAGFTGALVLKMLPGGSWRLSFQPASRAYSAGAGELIKYRLRTSAAAQDWLRFPVSGISGDDAQAYASWLARTGRVPFARLCDEAEWERAARGADGREFPSGADLGPGDANFDETYGKQPDSFGPDAVGTHSGSRSPFGVDDMAGNAWEWTTSALTPGQRVVRGGSFYHDRNSSRSSNREVPEQTMRDLTVGMRVCAGWK